MLIAESATPEGLRTRAKMLREGRCEKDSTARHLELAADEIERLRAELAAERERCAGSFKAAAEYDIKQAVAVERERCARLFKAVADYDIKQAVAAERERCAQVADSFRCGGCGMDGKAAAAIRKGE